MILQAIYIFWKYLVRSIAIFGVFLLIASSIVLIFLQVPGTRNYFIESIEKNFQSKYYGQLDIGSIEGFIPFNATIHNISFLYDEHPEAQPDTIIHIKSVSLSLNPFDLLSNKLSVQSLSITDPYLNLEFDDDRKFYTINRVFQSRAAGEAAPENVVRRIEILAPFFSVENGSIRIEMPPESQQYRDGNEVVYLENIHLSSFVEFTNEMRFIDLQYLFMDVSPLATAQVRFKGQIYSDTSFLEFNGFNFVNDDNEINLTGEIRDFDILDDHRAEQLKNASYYVSVDSTRIRLSDYRSFWSDLGQFTDVLGIHSSLRGGLDDLIIDKLDISYGNSRIESSGDVQALGDLDNVTYLLDIRTLEVKSDELLSLFGDVLDQRINVLDNVVTQGRVQGDARSTDLDLILISGEADLRVDGRVNWSPIPDYRLLLNTNDFNLNVLLPESFPQSVLNSEILLTGRGLDEDTVELDLVLRIFNSRISDYPIDQLRLEGRYANKNLSSAIEFVDGGTLLNGSLDVDLTGIPVYALRGDFFNVDLRRYIQNDYVSTTDLDFEINLAATGRTLSDITGRVNLDVNRAIVNGDTLQNHQFYADILDYGRNQREFRFTSTLLDFNLRGDIDPARLQDVYLYWFTYVNERIHEEILLAGLPSLSDRPTVNPISDEVLNLDFSLIVKDASLVQKYINELPYIDINMNFEGNFQANNSRILINTELTGSELYYGTSTLTDYNIISTMSLLHGRRLKDFSVIDVVVRAEEIVGPGLEVHNASVGFSMLNDSASVTGRVGSVGTGDYGGDFALGLVFSDSLITARIGDFHLGNERYQWSIPDGAVMAYGSDQRLNIQNLGFVNGEQRIQIDGVYSDRSEDLVAFNIEKLDMGTLSDLMSGRTSFSGTVNGTFETSMLFIDPVISGSLFVDHLKIDERTIGDVDFLSRFNSLKNRFDVEMIIRTDSQKYADYLSGNNNVGQDIRLSGWINAPDNPVSADTLFYFDVDLREIDTWVVRPIVPSVFVSVEGVGRGSGKLWGTADHLDFNAKFDVEDIQVVPEFLYVNYSLNGVVELDRDEGITFRDIRIRDRRNGTGVLNGNIGFNSFQPERPFNLVMDMTNLEFLNNSFDPDIPFYGNVSGTGRVSLTGSNIAPYLRTLTPVTTTTDSRLSIPLLDETSVGEQSRFIEFVKSFSEIYEPKTVESQAQAAARDDGFTDIARMDLQFIAPLNSSVQLVFDPLTGEVLNARGSGRIRVTLEDGNFQMFGNFDINSGDYVFVGGDIFVRRFQLRNGGTISWVGDPANAALNITTAYRSRPNIDVLATTFSNQQTRIPVDLMLEITGTIQSIQNNFYFEFPNATDVSQNATALSLLNSEDQKLIQATSLLFTGGFIPVGAAGEGQSSQLGATLQARAGQVGLSQLLSNQINAILNSSLRNLDIDLNLTGFDQADIGIALRLFDDRLVLRGESQYTSAAESGAETTLGDVGITYRINRALSLEVFHRRDPTLRSIVGNQSQAESINGIGLEAQVQFNSWKEFRGRLWAQVRRVFGSNESKSDTTSS